MLINHCSSPAERWEIQQWRAFNLAYLFENILILQIEIWMLSWCQDESSSFLIPRGTTIPRWKEPRFLSWEQGQEEGGSKTCKSSLLHSLTPNSQVTASKHFPPALLEPLGRALRSPWSLFSRLKSPNQSRGSPFIIHPKCPELQSDTSAPYIPCAWAIWAPLQTFPLLCEAQAENHHHLVPSGTRESL